MNLLEQNRALLRAADADVPQALAGQRPVLAFVANASHRWTEGEMAAAGTGNGSGPRSTNNARDIGATLDLVLFDSGATRFSVDAAKETFQATREALRQIEQQVLLEAVSA